MESKINIYVTKSAKRQFEARKPRSMRSVSTDKFSEEMEFYIGCHAKAGTEFNRRRQLIVYNECMIVTMKALRLSTYLIKMEKW